MYVIFIFDEEKIKESKLIKASSFFHRILVVRLAEHKAIIEVRLECNTSVKYDAGNEREFCFPNY